MSEKKSIEIFLRNIKCFLKKNFYYIKIHLLEYEIDGNFLN